ESDPARRSQTYWRYPMYSRRKDWLFFAVGLQWHWVAQTGQTWNPPLSPPTTPPGHMPATGHAASQTTATVSLSLARVVEAATIPAAPGTGPAGFERETAARHTPQTDPAPPPSNFAVPSPGALPRKRSQVRRCPTHP